MKYFIKKWYKLITSIFSFFINSIGLIISLVQIIYGSNNDSNNYNIFFVLAIAELFLIISIFYSIFSVFNNKSEQLKVNEKINEIERISNANRIIYENNKSVLTTYKDCTDSLRLRVQNYLDNNARLNELKGQGEVVEKQEEFKKMNEIAKISISDYVKDERDKEFHLFRNVLIDDYNRFLGNITNILRRSLEEYISTKKCSNDISVTLKQLDEPTYFNQINKSNIRVFTAFRDNRTYNSKKRTETWQKSFSISKNSDFFMSIKNEYYIFNFYGKGDMEHGSYHNENISFYENYNSGVTCTVHSCINGEKKLFGYLACDSLFDEKVKQKYGNNIFDWNTANLMMHVAHIIAMYLEKFLNIWDSYCVDFNPDLPIIMRKPEDQEEKERALQNEIKNISQKISSCDNNSNLEILEFNKQKTQNKLNKLTENKFCNVMTKKIEKSRYQN